MVIKFSDNSAFLASFSARHLPRFFIGRRHLAVMSILVSVGICLGLPAAAEDIPPYELGLLKNGTEMELAGGMPAGTTAAVKKMLDASPAIRVIHLNSVGGDMSEGVQLGRLIRLRHLITYTSTTCASACTVAFLAGSERYLGENGWLGFHSAAKKWGGDSFAAGNVAFRKIYQELGLPDSMIDKALATAPRDVWYPSHEELLAAHAVDAVVDNRRFAVSGIPHWRNAEDVDAIMKMNEFYAVLAAHDAANYALLRDMYLQGAQAGRTIREIEIDVNKVTTTRLLPFYVRIAPDEPLIRYWRSQIAELQFLSRTDPKACAGLAFPKLGIDSGDLEHLLPTEMQREDIAALTAVITGALNDPQQTPKGAAAMQEIEVVIATVQKTSPASLKIVGNPEAYLSDPGAICDAALVFSKAFFAMPGNKGPGPALRSIFSML